jgi:anti-sigma B factor antagonist
MGAQDQLRIEVRHGTERVIVRMVGELDMATAPLLQSAIDAAELGPKAMVVLDLQQLRFIDSTGLRAVLQVRERCRERGQEFAVTRGSAQVQRLLSVTGVDQHLSTVAPSDELRV